jgi:polar amino acid transport system substrate-binding protein
MRWAFRPRESTVIGDFMQAVYRELAPEGTLRVALNLGNVVLNWRDAASGEPRGLAVDLADELARRLSRPRRLLEFDGAGRVVEAGFAGAWDLAFLSIDPGRAQHFDFTAPYVVLESTYLVRDGSPYRTPHDLDRVGVRIAVGQGGFYDLHLARTLHHATVRRAPTSRDAVELFHAEGLDAVAGLRQPMAAAAQAGRGLHVLEGRFAAVEQAIAVPKGRSAGLRYLNAFVEQMKVSGLPAATLQRTLHAPGR